MTAPDDVEFHARRHARWHWAEIVFWTAALACAFIFPSRYLIMTDIVRLGLFALSLDLILGYAGIVSLGHAAYFGAGAYAAGVFGKHVVPGPAGGLLVGIVVAAVLGALTSPMIVRGTDLTRLMVTMVIALVLEELANKFDNI